ncbi:hypothetical protein [Shewanella sp.]|uniref:hypothetical protein n=1 Tax=Shewanella sp. TaxID=50422 RepID=UPI003562C0B0
MAKADKRLEKMCRKAARKSLGFKKRDIRDKALKAKVSELAGLLQNALPEAPALHSKAEKKATRRTLKQMAADNLKAFPQSANDDTLPAVRMLRPAIGTMAFALTPLKRKPCGGCAAKRGGLCQCALKLAKRKAG